MRETGNYKIKLRSSTAMQGFEKISAAILNDSSVTIAIAMLFDESSKLTD